MNYVLVTGASAGIGETFARELAKEGENLILVARREERLSALASDLMQTFGISVETLAADLSSPDGVNQVIKAVASNQWQLRGLINNAGFGDRGQFHELSVKRQLDMIQVNVTSLGCPDPSPDRQPAKNRQQLYHQRGLYGSVPGWAGHGDLLRNQGLRALFLGSPA